MSNTNYNFGLGNRALTPEESRVVEKTKRALVESLHRSGNVVSGNAIASASSGMKAKATVSRPVKSRDNAVKEALSTNAPAPASRRY